MVAKIKIDKPRTAPPRLMYPFRKLRKHQSFFIEGRESEASVRSQASKQSRHLKRKFSVRREDGGLRVYREA